jgi:hypothetical protein
LVTVPGFQITIDVSSQDQTLRKCIQCIVGLGRLKLLLSEQTSLRVGVKPEPIQEPVLAKCDDNHLPKHGMVRAIMVNDQDSLINLKQR